jgi:hypothetical protein
LFLISLAAWGCRAEAPAEPGGPGVLIEAWVDMWNRYDLDQVDALFLDDDRLSYFSSEKEGLIRGMASVRAHHVEFGFVPGGKDQPNRLWLEEVSIDRFGETAVVTGIWYFQSGTDAGEGEGGVPGAETAAGADNPPQKGPVVFVCLNGPGGWRFVHMAFSEYLALEEG